MDQDREDYADKDLPPPVRAMPEIVWPFLKALGVLGMMAVVSILVRAFLAPD
jgi:hypothetical protein